MTARIFETDHPLNEEEEANEQWNLMKPLRLPSYRETLERFNTDPPSYEEPGENEAPSYSEQQIAEQSV